MPYTDPSKEIQEKQNLTQEEEIDGRESPNALFEGFSSDSEDTLEQSAQFIKARSVGSLSDSEDVLEQTAVFLKTGTLVRTTSPNNGTEDELGSPLPVSKKEVSGSIVYGNEFLVDAEREFNAAEVVHKTVEVNVTFCDSVARLKSPSNTPDPDNKAPSAFEAVCLVTVNEKLRAHAVTEKALPQTPPNSPIQRNSKVDDDAQIQRNSKVDDDAQIQRNSKGDYDAQNVLCGAHLILSEFKAFTNQRDAATRPNSPVKALPSAPKKKI